MCVCVCVCVQADGDDTIGCCRAVVAYTRLKTHTVYLAWIVLWGLGGTAGGRGSGAEPEG